MKKGYGIQSPVYSTFNLPSSEISDKIPCLEVEVKSDPLHYAI